VPAPGTDVHHVTIVVCLLHERALSSKAYRLEQVAHPQIGPRGVPRTHGDVQTALSVTADPHPDASARRRGPIRSRIIGRAVALGRGVHRGWTVNPANVPCE
jgi:hypothetical protein